MIAYSKVQFAQSLLFTFKRKKPLNRQLGIDADEKHFYSCAKLTTTTCWSQSLSCTCRGWQWFRWRCRRWAFLRRKAAHSTASWQPLPAIGRVQRERGRSQV